MSSAAHTHWRSGLRSAAHARAPAARLRGLRGRRTGGHRSPARTAPQLACLRPGAAPRAAAHSERSRLSAGRRPHLTHPQSQAMAACKPTFQHALSGADHRRGQHGVGRVPGAAGAVGAPAARQHGALRRHPARALRRLLPAAGPRRLKTLKCCCGTAWRALPAVRGGKQRSAAGHALHLVSSRVTANSLMTAPARPAGLPRPAAPAPSSAHIRVLQRRYHAACCLTKAEAVSCPVSGRTPCCAAAHSGHDGEETGLHAASEPSARACQRAAHVLTGMATGGGRLPPITSRREANSPPNAFLNRGFAFQAPAWKRCGLHQVRRMRSAACSTWSRA